MNGLSDKASSLMLECQFTDGKLAGQTRVLEGWFLYAEGGTRKDENNDGKDDSSKAALPLLIGGTWKGGTKDYKLEPISPNAKPENATDKALEEKIILALPGAMRLAGKTIDPKQARQNIPLILSECRHAKVTDSRAIAYILVTASWESLMGTSMYENPSYKKMKQNNWTEEEYFNDKYDGYNGNGDVASGDGYRFRGRGFVQLTGRELYATATRRLKELDFRVDGTHPDLIEDPDLVATNRPLAALVLVFGMKEGWFTKTVGLEKHSKNHTKAMMYPKGKLNFNEARWIVNGNDTDSKMPMSTAAESLSATIGDKTKNDGVLELAADEYAKMRQIDRDGFDSKEVKKMTAGIEIGSLDGVAGYYNGPEIPRDWGRNSVGDYDTGLKWQCVEYVRRYYYTQYGKKMGAGRHGGMFFSAGVADGKSGIDGLNQYAYDGNTTQPQNRDGFSIKPQKGDVFIAGGGDYGHVAIVAEVTDSSIRIAQQNMAGQGFIFDVPMSLQSNGKWRLQYGIMRVSGLLRQP